MGGAPPQTFRKDLRTILLPITIAFFWLIATQTDMGNEIFDQFLRILSNRSENKKAKKQRKQLQGNCPKRGCGAEAGSTGRIPLPEHNAKVPPESAEQE